MFHQESRSNAQGSLPRGSISKFLVSNDLSSENRIPYIKRLLAEREEQQAGKGLEPDNASRFVELLDEVLRENRLDGKDRRLCMRYLARVCGWHSILPSSMQIWNHQRVSELVGTAHSSVWTGRYNGQKVVIKAFNIYASDGERRKRELTMAFCKEVVIWKHLDHPNILPFFGAMMVAEPRREKYEMVSEFMENGEIGTFTKRNQSVNRFKLLKDAGEGLRYLHSQSVVHGDLKGPNILISKDLRACLADFGLTRVLAEFMSSGPQYPGGTTVWMSPELLWPEKFKLDDAKPTRESDVYALGILIYEVICGCRPHPELGEWAAAEKLQQGVLPLRPEVGFTDSLWKTLESCWQSQRNMRPSVNAVLRELDQASRA